MKIKFSLLAITAGLFLSGYKEHLPGDGGVSMSKKIVRTNIRDGQSVSFNADGTPTSISWLQAGSRCVKTFFYGPGRISYTVMIDDKKKEHGEYRLAGGKITTLDWTHFDESGKPSGHYLETFTYNLNGLLARHSFNNSWSEYVYDEDQNLVRTSHYNSQGKPTTIVEYEYGGTRDLFPAMNYFNKDGSGFFMPAFSRFLPASKKVTRVVNGEVTLKGRFSYVLDADGYVLKGKWDAISAGDTDSEWSNTFQ
jgi:hypothetical protein